MMFMLLFYGDDRKISEILEKDPASLMSRHVQFNVGIVQQQSKLIASHALRPASNTMTVRPVDGTMTVLPGPAEQTRMVLNGFYLINCKDMDEALQITQQYPMPDDLGYIEVRPAVQEWKTAPIVDSPAAPETIWSLYADVDAWPSWMDGVAAAKLDGPFARGTTGELRMGSGDILPIRLAMVNELEAFSMEIQRAEGIWLWVGHYLTPSAGGGTRITHEPVVPHAALDIFGIHFTQSVNAQEQASLEKLAHQALTSQRANG